MQWNIEEAPDHLLVTVEGEWLLAPILKMLDEVARESGTRGYDSVLFDCRAVAGLAAEADKFVIGSRVAARFGKTRVAAVFNTSLRLTQFAARVAENRGGNICVTHEMDEALRYLAGEAS